MSQEPRKDSMLDKFMKIGLIVLFVLACAIILWRLYNIQIILEVDANKLIEEVRSQVQLKLKTEPSDDIHEPTGIDTSDVANHTGKAHKL